MRSACLLARSPEAELEGHVRTLQKERRVPSVSAAVFRGQEVVWEFAVGLADIESETPAAADTQYRIGSITKTFTAAAILQLRDAGRLSLDEPLAERLPRLGDRRATIRAVLAHASGLQREPPGTQWEPMASPTRDELLGRLGEVEHVLEPQVGWHYSNLGFVLLGEVVADAAGVPYERYVDERLLAPAGLTQTTWAPTERAATGYYVEPWSDRVHVERVVDMSGEAAAGALWSTARDVARWGAFLRDPNPDVLQPETAREMQRLQSMADTTGWRLAWGLGLALYRSGERILAGHSGGMNGFLANVAWDIAGAAGAVLLVNAHSNFSIDNAGVELAVKAAELVVGAPGEWRPGAPPPRELEGVLGNWWSEGWEFVFAFREGQLQATVVGAAAGRPPAVFEPESTDVYRTVSGRERGELLEIERDSEGRPVKLFWATYPFTRTPEPYT